MPCFGYKNNFFWKLVLFVGVVTYLASTVEYMSVQTVHIALTSKFFSHIPFKNDLLCLDCLFYYYLFSYKVMC